MGRPHDAQGALTGLLALRRLGDVLTAQRTERHTAGKTGVYDKTVTHQEGRIAAPFRSRSLRLRGRVAAAHGGDPR